MGAGGDGWTSGNGDDADAGLMLRILRMLMLMIRIE